MKMRIGIISAITAFAVAAISSAQPPGTFSTSLAWDPYSDTNAVALRLTVRSPATTNVYVITNIAQTVLTIPTDAGITYRAQLVAMGRYGIDSDPSNELTWTNPVRPSTPGMPRIAIINYVP